MIPVMCVKCYNGLFVCAYNQMRRRLRTHFCR